MVTYPLTRLARALGDVQSTDQIDDLARGFFDQTATLRLAGCAASAPVGIGAHVRRSFLGALGDGASDPARANLPCPWEPPCALDVFRREQLRGPRGDGLPKPYVIETDIDGVDLIVRLRVFGMANDWFMAATEAMLRGLRTILPWSRLFPGRTACPEVLSRQVDVGVLRVMPPDTSSVALVFTAPADTGGFDPKADPNRILSSLLRRVDGISRWNGLALDDDAGRAFAAFTKTLSYDATGLRLAGYQSPNAKGQSRVKRTMLGVLKISGALEKLWPVLAMGERCHFGRGAVEGLGAFRISPD